MQLKKNNLSIVIRVFPIHFELANQTGLPMYFHSRNAEIDFLTILKSNRKLFTNGVVHSFTGTKSELREIIDLGLYIGVNGCSLKTQEGVENIRCIPSDRLLIESALIS